MLCYVISSQNNRFNWFYIRYTGEILCINCTTEKEHNWTDPTIPYHATSFHSIQYIPLPYHIILDQIDSQKDSHKDSQINTQIDKQTGPDQKRKKKKKK